MTEFRAKDVRHFLIAKARILNTENPDKLVIEGLDWLIGDYRSKIGLKTYLSQMLGEWATEPTGHFRFFDESGREITLTDSQARLIDGLARQSPLPFIVRQGNGQERYL